MTVKIDGSTGVDTVQPGSVDKEDLKWVPPFTKEYVSPEQTISAGSGTQINHTLGVLPKILGYDLICKVAEHGYSVGEVLDIGRYDYGGSGNSWQASVVKSDTALYIRYGSSGMLVPHKTTGVATTVTPASWRLIVRAWA